MSRPFANNMSWSTIRVSHLKAQTRLRQVSKEQFSGPGPGRPTQTKTSRRTGVKKYSLLYFFTEVDVPRAARKAPKGLVNEQVAQENLRYRSPTSQAARASTASRAGGVPIEFLVRADRGTDDGADSFVRL
jgi:hypothetical protein